MMSASHVRDRLLWLLRDAGYPDVLAVKTVGGDHLQITVLGAQTGDAAEVWEIRIKRVENEEK